ncbi:hypothetical protein YC2023_067291 [Brassica napus]
MVKSPVPETDKGPLRRSRRTESVPLLSTPSSSTATKRSRKKKVSRSETLIYTYLYILTTSSSYLLSVSSVSDERQSWLKEQFLPLTPPTLLGCRGDVDRIKGIASLIRRLIYQAKSNVLALTFSNLITFSETNGRLARQNRRSMRAQKRNNALQQEIQHNADAILAKDSSGSADGETNQQESSHYKKMLALR